MSDLSVLLQVSGHLHRQALDTIGVPFYLANRAGVLLWLNAKAKALHGDVVGRPYSSVVAPEQLSYARCQFARKITGEASATDYDLILLDSEGRRVPARVHSVSLASDDHGAAVFGLAIPTSAEADESLPSEPDAGSRIKLSNRQHETLLLLGEGLGTSEIAARLSISRETARNHIRAIMGTLDAHSRLEAVAIAHRIGLLPPRS